MHSRHLFLVILVLSATALWAQNHNSAPQKILTNSTKISNIHVDGSKRYSSSELVSATGLKIGDEGADAALRAGADTLGASGMFKEVTYSYISSPRGTEVRYEVQDVAVLYEARFDNFVWLQHDELMRALQQRHPLFRGKLPGAGDMYKQLEDDARAILEEKHIAATVSAMPVIPQLGGDITGFSYHVQGVRIPITAIEFPGADPEMAKALGKTAAVRIDTDYTESGLDAFARFDLLPLYMERGYLHARIQSPEYRLTDATSSSVAVQFPVEEGLLYQLKELQWSGNTAFSAQELAKALKVDVGKAANQPLLEERLGEIRKLYGKKGYMEARIEPVPVFDDDTRTVLFRAEVKEGEQYRFGSLRVVGAPEAVTKKLNELWKLRPGDVYDNSQPEVALQGLARIFDLSSVRVQVSTSLHKENKTADFVIRFTPRQM